MKIRVIKNDYYEIYNDMPGWLSKDQPKWHYKVYDMWREMHSRVKHPDNKRYSNYKDCEIHPSLDYLSNYANFILNEPNFDLFVNTYDTISWTVDKDIKVKGNRKYYPEFMTLCTKSVNSSEVNTRTKRKPIIGISLHDNSFILYKYILQVEDDGFDPSAVAKCCKGKWKHHKYKGYKWYYLDMNDRG